MKPRRSFFKRIAAVIAVVALAPEIAFRSALELPRPQLSAFLECERMQNAHIELAAAWLKIENSERELFELRYPLNPVYKKWRDLILREAMEKKAHG